MLLVVRVQYSISQTALEFLYVIDDQKFIIPLVSVVVSVVMISLVSSAEQKFYLL